ncbi:helix-turn-helix domain-containing protein [Flavobacterium cerinum]|uniref:Helix-turn-helix domain-containing protein n=1 Tax=Flavobacterium cerinum TaxID=2502784 RepID=A0ABY5J0H3_9FLAO|nr:helix-turn-helix transcriptional regulator [Flavobacterium cerinum]UUC47256.1 helix-turn-helix domain-containing protein [Flavobacterium cerinum]
MNRTVGAKIRHLRKTRGYSQEEVAEKLNISQSAYARIENGESQSWASHIEQLSVIFEVKPKSFLSKHKDNTSTKKQKDKLLLRDSLIVLNEVYEKLIDQYEKRLQEKDELIALLKKTHHNSF